MQDRVSFKSQALKLSQY